MTVADYDNDGFDDLFITYYGQNVLYRNNGDGTFTDVTERAACVERGPIRVRLHMGGLRPGWTPRSVRRELPEHDDREAAEARRERRLSLEGVPVNCGPRGLPTGFVQLFHNNGDGTFRDVSRESSVAAASGAYPMTAVVVDVDNDGWPDVYVACDSTPSWLFRNQKDGTFREEGLERGVALSEDGMEQAGMGLGIGDFDLDGHPDIFKTHFADDTNVLYAERRQGYFDDFTIRAGIGVETSASDGEPGWWT